MECYLVLEKNNKKLKFDIDKLCNEHVLLVYRVQLSNFSNKLQLRRYLGKTAIWLRRTAELLCLTRINNEEYQIDLTLRTLDRLKLDKFYIEINNKKVDIMYLRMIQKMSEQIEIEQAIENGSIIFTKFESYLDDITFCYLTIKMKKDK